MKSKKVPLSQFITLQRGYDLTKKNMNDGNYPVVGSTSIIGYHDAYKVDSPGVVTGRSGSLGTVQFLNTKFWPHNTSLWVKDFKGNDPSFVYYSLKNLPLADFNAGAGVPTLNRNHLDQLMVTYFPVEYQKKVSVALRQFDNLIENNNHRIQILEEIPQRLYEEWFVNFKFPGHEKMKMIDSELGKIPGGWIVSKVDDLIITYPRSGKLKKSEYLESGKFLVVDQGDGLIAGYCDDESLVNKTLPVVIFGDHTRRFKYIDFPFVCGADGTQILYPRDEILLPVFFYYLISRIQIKNEAYARHFKFLKEKKVIVPISDLINQFNSLVSPFRDEIGVLTKKNDDLTKTRDLLLPRLISGEIEL